MKFYTNAEVYGSNVLVREVVDGVRSLRKEKWNPSIFIQSNKDEKHKTLFGQPATEVKPGTIRETRDFIKQYEGTDGFEIYGQLNYTLQYLYQYDLTGWNYKSIRCYSIDIETAMPDSGGFPKPENAEGEILLITIQDIHTQRCFTFGTKPFDGDETRYTYCKDEKQLIRFFLAFWQQLSPDIITGWNVDGFDIPYLINRIRKVSGEDELKKLSPWGLVDYEEETYAGKKQLKTKIWGVSVLDYLDLMKKYTYGNRESWSLGSVAQEELDETKLENPAPDFKSFYSDPQYWPTFVRYNVKDSVLVTKLDKKMRLIELALTIAYKARVNYSDVFSPVKTWDAILHNTLMDSNVVIPQRRSTGVSGHEIEGAYVKEPEPGFYEYVSSIDATSLYPSIMMGLNISPETYAGKVDSNAYAILDGKIDTSEYIVNDYAIGANGAIYRRGAQGVIPKVVDTFMVERKRVKGDMLSTQQEVENLKKGDAGLNEQTILELESKIASLDNEQMAYKILLNSLYGAMGNKGFRFYNPDVAESITTTGQLYLLSLERGMDKKISTAFKLDGKYLIYADTDSAYFCLSPIIMKYYPESTPEQKIRAVEKITKEFIQKFANEISDEVNAKLNVFRKTIFFKQEIAADKAIWVGKKRYICRVHSSEGVRYSKPKYKAMGLELVRSSTPKFIREALRDSLDVIFMHGEEATQEYIQAVKKKFMEQTIEEVAFPRGVSELEKFESGELTIPINVRGSLTYNRKVKELGLEDTCPLINEGDKIKFIYLKLPNRLHQNVIAWPGDGKLPEQFGVHSHIDYELQFQKTFVDAISNILDPIGWSAEKVSTLEEFFG